MKKTARSKPSRIAPPPESKGSARILSSRLLHRGKVFSVERASVVEPGGVAVVREIVRHPGAAVILPLLDDGGIILIRQFRIAVDQNMWELPAGTLDPDEAPLQTARRELIEETGYRGTRWNKLAEFYPSPGFVSERMSLYLARGLRAGMANPEEDEKIAVHRFSTAQLRKMLAAGKIRDAKTLVGLLYWFQFGKKKFKGKQS